MCNPITSVSGNVQSQLPSCKWKGEKPWEHRHYLGKTAHREISRVPSRTCGHRTRTRISCQQEFLLTAVLPQPVCPACPDAFVHLHKCFWAALFTEIGFTVEVTWTCSMSGITPCCSLAFLSKESRGQNPRSEDSRHTGSLAVPEAGEISTFLISC